ncbi:N(2)-acetyl-L-2,4-diaminobutanoate deacetylase DoeB [Ruegeria pomeroyi]|uniref:N-acetyl-L-2,4-diaminobutyric acid deacetylase n=2 Tax=Ruegeria pomeroyi TaxID=89184 RepID=Q5LUB5_RUEPO|nr:N(2)-acetyl-L-2,4-diaminobutanoate deacetylase DoeB [Ruegeria pomeroyi]HCE70348.1 N-alpha-acetyl diaminobutyric acid deacetylase DoeB [Ruegeria sp.]AAV94439.1 ectoine utilization protein EutE [Ruegeria pomeroyi DSS-3]NVK99441.1 N-alpha-acetyl diaminobutyric acid deacetylase DoeB [Ruegeria pomeroyi]NVL03305.1 N-alpha-acetyl diaminobutyric acid deacetylase DoeB [Ruegeria pomeroyi]QWV08021.1 N(2)-acetyl-L-2,4-diaminobutanoate deacetylase DoeB [Ruegeria pomeroyi]
MQKNPISPTIPLDRDGVFHGFLKLPHSRDDSAWGSVMIPLTVIKNGAGPTALLTGANHGDEYEGPVALHELAATTSAEDVTGRLIIVPAFNYPAFRAGSRTSPIDRGNLNRSFPGRPDGTVTEKIADYFQRTLLPMADLAVDFHSGGKTLDFVPFAAAHILEDKATQAACFAAMKAFNAPYSVELLEIDSAGMYDTAVEEMGKVLVTTELGGGGSSSARSNAIAKKGLRNVLIHAGILKGEMQLDETVNLTMPDDDCFVFSEGDGLFEMMIDLGAPVAKGDLLARVWPLDRTGQPPVEYRARRAGLVISRHFPGLIKSGDCVAVVGVTGA